MRLTHTGFPYPDNIALASRLESVVREHGGIPATIGVLDGVARVGMNPEQLIQLVSSSGQDTTLKISKRDLSYVCGLVTPTSREHTFENWLLSEQCAEQFWG